MKHCGNFSSADEAQMDSQRFAENIEAILISLDDVLRAIPYATSRHVLVCCLFVVHSFHASLVLVFISPFITSSSSAATITTNKKSGAMGTTRAPRWLLKLNQATMMKYHRARHFFVIETQLLSGRFHLLRSRRFKLHFFSTKKFFCCLPSISDSSLLVSTQSSNESCTSIWHSIILKIHEIRERFDPLLLYFRGDYDLPWGNRH